MMALPAYIIYEPQFLPKSPPILDVVTPEEFQSKPDISKGKTEIVKDLLKDIFGYTDSKPRNWLILNQDYLEARPTGGFPGTYMYLTTQNGEVKNIEFDDIWNFDKPLKKAKKPQLNQSSWWAHFPTSALYSIKTFKNNTGKPVDGVMALDPTAVKYLLEVTGEIRVPEYKETVNSKNITDRILSYSPYIKNGKKKAQHKDFMASTVKAMHGSFFTYDVLTKRNDLARAFLRGLERKHILLYSAKKDIQDILAANDWDGALNADVKTDLLAIRDYNAGINKVDLYINKDAKYEVDVSNGRPKVKLTVEYRYKYDRKLFDKYGPMAEPRFRDYKNIQKIYVPKGSKLLGSSGYDGFVEQSSEDGLTVFKGPINLKPDSTQKVSLSYELPFVVKTEYKLLISKQPGQPVFDTKASKVEIIIKIGKKHVDAYFPNFRTFKESELGFKNNLEYDSFVKLRFK